jgi:hypothetical protein
MNEINENNNSINLINSTINNNKQLINTPLGNNSIPSQKNISNEILYFSINQDSK